MEVSEQAESSRRKASIALALMLIYFTTETLRILPRRGARPTPDLQHMTLQMLSLIAAVLTVRAYVQSRAV